MIWVQKRLNKGKLGIFLEQYAAITGMLLSRQLYRPCMHDNSKSYRNVE